MEKANETVDRIGLTYSVAYGMDAETISRITGAYYDINKKFIHATGFLIRPDNTIEVASYSSGPIGRFVAHDVLRLVRFYKSK
jgi:hypothetical protein